MIESDRDKFINLKREDLNDKFDIFDMKMFANIKSRFCIVKTPEELENITPEIICCRTKSEKRLFRLLMEIQSLHIQSDIPGRNLTYIVQDKNSGKLLGMLRLTSSSCNVNRPLNTYLNWNDVDKFKNRKLQHLVYAQAMVPTQPFGYNCLGGKLLAKLACCREILDIWDKKYVEKAFGVLTLSMSTGISQYSGMKEFIHLGEAAGRTAYFFECYDNTRQLFKNETITGVDKRLSLESCILDWKNKAMKRLIKLQSENKIKTDIDTYDTLIDSTENAWFC